MNQNTPPPEPDHGPTGTGKLVSVTQTTRMMHDALGLVDGPTEQLAERLLNEPPGWFEAAYQAHFAEAVGVPLPVVLAGEATIDQLVKAKSIGKRAFAGGGADADAGLLLYFVAASTALVHHGRWITTIQPESFEQSVALLAGCASGPEQQALAAWLDLCAGE